MTLGDVDGVIHESARRATLFPSRRGRRGAVLRGRSARASARGARPQRRAGRLYRARCKQPRAGLRQRPGRHRQDLARRRPRRRSCSSRAIVDRLVLSRPAVEAGERLGFLPGDMREKVDPYLRPLYDALYDMMPRHGRARHAVRHDRDRAARLHARPHAANAIVLLDEAQNTTTMQMKMFLTRLGEGSRMIVTGDPTQIDLPPGQKSGPGRGGRILRRASRASAASPSSEGDVVRHELVRQDRRRLRVATRAGRSAGAAMRTRWVSIAAATSPRESPRWTRLPDAEAWPSAPSRRPRRRAGSSSPPAPRSAGADRRRRICAGQPRVARKGQADQRPVLPGRAARSACARRRFLGDIVAGLRDPGARGRGRSEDDGGPLPPSRRARLPAPARLRSQTKRRTRERWKRLEARQISRRSAIQDPYADRPP